MIEVKQADRDQAGSVVDAGRTKAIKRGEMDHIPLVQAFAAHRQQAEDAMKERAAKVCDVYSEVNFEAAGDSVLLDPVLRGKGFSPANVAASDKHQIDGLVHSSQAHAGQHLATAIRGIDTTKA